MIDRKGQIESFIQIGKEEINVFLSVDCIIIYVEYPKISQ